MVKNNRIQSNDEIRSIYTNVGDLKIHALASRKSDFAQKTPIVLLPGLGISTRYLIPAARELARSRNVFAPDFPGWGDSSKPRRVFDVPELAVFLQQWLKTQNIERANVIGHSFGGQIAAEFAAARPEMVEKIVLASTTYEIGKRQFFRQFWRFLRNAPREPLPLVFTAVRDYFKFGTRRQILTIKHSLRDKIEEKLPQINAPTLVLRGELDPIVPQNWAETMTRLLPKSELAVIPNGTHGVIYQSYREFAISVRSFLDC